MFLMTDDADVENATAGVSAAARLVLAPKGRPLRSTSAFMATAGDQDADFGYGFQPDARSEAPYFAAMFQLAAQCASLVANCESEFSTLVYYFMCAAQRRCPLLFDFGTARQCAGSTELAVNEDILYRQCSSACGADCDQFGRRPKACDPPSAPLAVPFHDL